MFLKMDLCQNYLGLHLSLGLCFEFLKYELVGPLLAVASPAYLKLFVRQGFEIIIEHDLGSIRISAGPPALSHTPAYDDEHVN